jgi:glycosyltransferase involved in cell wall biosynthesis
MLSVVIPAYNEEKYIGACLEALTKQDAKEPFEVIVVDNASTDRTGDVARSFAERLSIRIIREEKKGRGAARAAGFAAAKGEIIFSTDSDTVVPPQWMSTLFSALAKKQHVVAVVGVGSIHDTSWVANILFNTLQPVATFGYRMLFGHHWLAGFNFAIRKHAYQQAGGFNPELRSSEDTDLARRVKNVGGISAAWNVAVVCSGRRFQNGSTKGLLIYPWTWIRKFIFHIEDATLNDIR